MLSYVIVGSGYRAEYYGRIARTYPELFRAIFLCRSEEKAALMKAHTGIETTVSKERCISFRPDFIVAAVDRGHVADVTEEWVLDGYPVVAETPVADTEEKLCRIRELARQGGKIVCCEQYHRYPLLAEGLRKVSEGIIGNPSSAYLSLAHDYHAASLLRKALLISPGEAYVLHGTFTENEVTATDSRYGAVTDGQTAQARRDMIHISFRSGKEAIYDFSSVQYRSFIRSTHLTVRGSLGEWSDTVIRFVGSDHMPQRCFLLPVIPSSYAALDTQALRDRRRSWSAEVFPDTVQDEFAIASMLLDMKAYLAGGESPYPLEEALEDALFWLAVQKAVLHPWQETAVLERPWKKL